MTKAVGSSEKKYGMNGKQKEATWKEAKKQLFMLGHLLGQPLTTPTHFVMSEQQDLTPSLTLSVSSQKHTGTASK